MFVVAAEDDVDWNVLSGFDETETDWNMVKSVLWCQSDDEIVKGANKDGG